MKFSEFYEEIVALDTDIAPGSETGIFGDFVERYSDLVSDLCIRLVLDFDRRGESIEQHFTGQWAADSHDVPDAERRWWISVYRLLADQESKLRDGRLAPADALDTDALFSSVD